MKIAILDDYQDSVRHLSCYRLLEGHEVKVFTSTAKGIGQLAIRLAAFDAIVTIGERSRLSGALLRRLASLKVIAQAGPAGQHIDLDAATGCGIAVAEAAEDPVAPAELTWALILAAGRRVVPYSLNLRRGLWQHASTPSLELPLGGVLRGRTLGIWGYGRIGSLVAGYGRAFGMRVQVWGSEAARDRAQQDGHACATSKEALFAEADVLSLHLRFCDATRGAVTRQDLATMQPDALFVNTSHGGLVADGALLEALQDGRPGQAALDVFDSEPVPQDAPLLRLPNVVATPHIGPVERNSYESLFSAAFQNIIDFQQGKPVRLANPAVLQHPR